MNARPDDVDPVEVIRAGGLALEAAKSLAADPDDWAGVLDALGPVLEWMREWAGPADLEARQAAVRAVMGQPRRGGRRRPATLSPSQFVTAAEAVRLSLTPMLDDLPGPPGRGQVASGPEPAAPGGLLPGRLAYAVRNLLLAATEPGPGGDHDGWDRLLATAGRYGDYADPPVTAEEYDEALRWLFRGDPRAGAKYGPPGRAGSPEVGTAAGDALSTHLAQVLARLDDAERRLSDVRDLCDRGSFEAGGRAVWVIDVLEALLGPARASLVRHENLRPCYDRRCPECHPEPARSWAPALPAMPAMGDGARYDVGRPVEWDGEHPDGVEVIAEAVGVGEVNAMVAVADDLLLVRLAAPDTAGRQLPADDPAGAR